MNLLKLAQGPIPHLPPSTGTGSGSGSGGQVITPPTGIPLQGAGGGVTIVTPIVSVINFGLLVAGGVAVLVLIISGFFYVTAAGNEKSIERAKQGIKGAITGIVIMLLAAIIVNTINYALTR